MSTTETKRSHAAALADAEAFRAMFPPTTYERWEFAGSVRRRRPEVGDVEHVIIPAFGDVPSADLFATPSRVNLLWFHLDALLRGHELTKHLYGGTGYRWGEKYRGVDYRGFNHELFTADESNWGPTLAIRTGPADFSQRLVTSIRGRGHRQKDGYVWSCRPCVQCGGSSNSCPFCEGTNLVPVDRVGVPDELAYFALCGVMFQPAERRA